MDNSNDGTTLPAISPVQNPLFVSLTPSQVNFINAWCENNFHVTKATEAAGIARQTYYNWLRQDEFRSVLNSFNFAMALHGLQTIMDSMVNAEDPNLRFKAALEVVKAFHPKFKDRVDVTSNGNTVQAIVLERVSSRDEAAS